MTKEYMNIRNFKKKYQISLGLLLTASIIATSLLLVQGSSNGAHDVVIIGAGMTGLSAAYELNDLDVLVLEKEPRIGGRVFSKSNQQVPFEMGAITIHDSLSHFPFEIEREEFRKIDYPIGIFYKGETFFCQKVIDCIRQMDLSEKELKAIELFASNPRSDVVNMPPRAYSILNSFHRGIHVEELKKYSSMRQHDVLHGYRRVQLKDGNSGIAQKYNKRIQAEVLLEAEVVSVEESDRGVRIKYNVGKEVKVTEAKVAIVTTPGPIAKKIIKSMSPSAIQYLDSLDWGQHTFIAFDTKKTDDVPFSYIVTPDCQFDGLYRYDKPETDKNMYLVYYAENTAESEKISKLNDEEIVKRTKEDIKSCGIFDQSIISLSEARFTSVHRWKYSGIAISEKYYEQWSAQVQRPSKNIFLAGDYLYEKRDYIPFGIAAAIGSGKSIAGLVKRHLNKGNTNSP
jgi:protoporphyrinogen oxidase